MRRLGRWVAVHILDWHESWWDETDTLPNMGRALGWRHPAPRAAHDCGMCDGPIRYDGDDRGVPTWRCTRCTWWHTSTDCCVPMIGSRP